MEGRRIRAVLPVMLTVVLLLGWGAAPVRGQAYSVNVDFAFLNQGVIAQVGNSLVLLDGLVGEDLLVAGTVDVVVGGSESDRITVTLDAPDTGTVTTSLDVTAGFTGSLPFSLSHITFAPGQFDLTVRSQTLGELLNRSFSVPGYDIEVEVEPAEGTEATQFRVQTVLNVGSMTLLAGRFDVLYSVDGVEVLEESDAVRLVNSDFLDLLETFAGLPLPEDLRYDSWSFSEGLVLPPGNHSLEVRVFDHGLSAWVASESVEVRVTNATAALEESLEDELADARGELESLQRTSAAVLPLAALSVVALGASLLSLLIQFGILTVRRRG